MRPKRICQLRGCLQELNISSDKALRSQFEYVIFVWIESMQNMRYAYFFAAPCAAWTVKQRLQIPGLENRSSGGRFIRASFVALRTYSLCRPHLQEADKLVAEVMRLMLFKNGSNPGVPVKRDDILAVINKNYKDRRGLAGHIITLAQAKFVSIFGMEMKEELRVPRKKGAKRADRESVFRLFVRADHCSTAVLEGVAQGVEGWRFEACPWGGYLSSQDLWLSVGIPDNEDDNQSSAEAKGDKLKVVRSSERMFCSPLSLPRLSLSSSFSSFLSVFSVHTGRQILLSECQNPGLRPCA